MTASRTVVYRLTADIAGFQAKMAQASASTKKLADDLTGSGESSEASRAKLSAFGDTAGKVGLAAAAGLGVAIAASAKFEQGMSNVQAATHESAANMDLLRQAALDAGQATVFSATEAAAGIENLAKAGVSTADILSGGLTGALDLAAAGEMGVGEAAEVAATALTQFNLAGSDVPHVADLLAAGAGKAQGSVADMGMALKQGGLVASQMGVSLEEMTGTLAAFASAGLIGSDAGTSLKTMLLRLANPSKAAALTMEQFGIAAYDASGNMVSMSNLAGQLAVAFEGQDQATRDAALAVMFGSDAIRAANVLYTQGASGIADWTANVDDAGFAAETAAIRMDNLKGDIEGLKGAFETALIGTGESSQGPLRSVVQSLTALVNAYNDLPGPAKSAAAGILGVTAVAGGGLWAFSKMVTGLAGMRDALSTMGPAGQKAATSLGKVARTAGGIALAGTAAGMLADSIDRVDSDNLERALEALGRGEVTADLNQIIESLKFINSASNAGPDFGEFFTAGGLFGDSTRDKMEQNLDLLDQYLAKMVEAGDVAAAVDIFQDVAAKGEAAGIAAEQTAASLDAYVLAMRNADGVASPFAAANDAVKSAVEGATAAVDGSASALDKESDALDKNVDKMNKKRDAALRASDAEINYQAAIDDATAAARANGKTLDITTEKGRANRSALNSLAAAWNEQTEATKAADGARRAAIDGFVRTAVKMGMEEGKARDLARSLFDIPKKVNTAVTVDGVAASISSVEYYKRALERLDGTTATTYVVQKGYKAPVAAGGIFEGGVQTYATGGLDVADAHPPMVSTTQRVWAEPETKGEAYIPFADDWRRPRAIAIWQETGRRLGQEFQRFAAGGINGPAAAFSDVGMDLAALRREVALLRDPSRGGIAIQRDAAALVGDYTGKAVGKALDDVIRPAARK